MNVKKLKIASILYGTILHFAFFFILTLFFASGHKVTVGIEYYLTFIYIVFNSFLLRRFRKNQHEKFNLIFTYLLLSALVFNACVTLYFSLTIIGDDMEGSFNFFLSLISIAFLILSMILVKEIINRLKKFKTENI
ncbi:hypothetical protein [Chryseobacterium caseinilyticum]|uniref:Uncharacterized protein n=1 Tax=Chryseobacterium caseinilyticum TaxID=2771428 RepID=A0ABR8ZBC8_9FLAO|nr:hypothetical protein [Chryseobacterium caseinilyticum]MBD8082542.1 hypothetical protein [Chryseobacterium caseinilyticum]